MGASNCNPLQKQWITGHNSNHYEDYGDENVARRHCGD